MDPDYLCRIEVSQNDTYLELFMERYVQARRPVDTPEIAVTSGEFQNSVYKALAGCSLDPFVVLKYHTIYTV